MMNYTKIKYILYVVIVAYFIVALISLITVSQSLVFDPGLCIKMVDNGYKHIPFNYYSHPKPTNLNEDEIEFVTWWSPGQFAAPLLIQKCLGVKVGVALKILIMFCMIISALGIFKLFNTLLQKADFTNSVPFSITILSLACLLFTIAQPFFWGNVNVYDGGGILMLAYCPWFIYWVIKIRRINIYTLLILLLGSIFGFFLKSSFTSVFLGSLFFVFLSILPHKPLKAYDIKQAVINAIYLLVASIIYIVIIKAAFLDHSRNISDSSLGIRLQPRILFYPIIAPLFGLFSLDFLNRTYQWIIGSVIILSFYYLIFKNSISLLYKYVLVSFIGAFFAFYCLLYLLNVDVSYELRHYRIITILLTPAFFITLREFNFAKYLAYALITLYFTINIYSYVNNLITAFKNKGPVSDVSGIGFAYPIDLIKKLHDLDDLKNNGKDIFCFKYDNPSIALEIRNNRVLLDQSFVNFHFGGQPPVGSIKYFGINSGKIYVIYAPNQSSQDSVAYFNQFDKYKKFKNIYQTNGYIIFEGIASGNK